MIPADETFLAGDDLGVLRGDGVFETANVRAGEPFLLEEHLARMVRSAERMQLDLPDVTKLAELAADACQAFGRTGRAHCASSVPAVPKAGGRPRCT